MGRFRRRKPSTDPAAGDVVVTKVTNHYHIGRVEGDRRPFVTIAVRSSRTEALAVACQSATGHQRVFLYGTAGTTDCVEIDCADIGAAEPPTARRSKTRRSKAR